MFFSQWVTCLLMFGALLSSLSQRSTAGKKQGKVSSPRPSFDILGCRLKQVSCLTHLHTRAHTHTHTNTHTHRHCVSGYLIWVWCIMFDENYRPIFLDFLVWLLTHAYMHYQISLPYQSKQKSMWRSNIIF